MTQRTSVDFARGDFYKRRVSLQTGKSSAGVSAKDPPLFP